MNITINPLMKKTMTAFFALSLPVMGMAATNATHKWKIDLPKTKVNFQVSYLKNSIITGRFKEVTGVIKYDENNPQATKINFTVQTDSIDTDLKPRDYFIRRKELLNTKEYPTLKFVSTSVRLINPREGYVSGNFTALGHTKPLTVKVKLTDGAYNTVTNQPVLKFTATGRVNRHDYGVTAFPGIFGTTIPIIISGELKPSN